LMGFRDDTSYSGDSRGTASSVTLTQGWLEEPGDDTLPGDLAGPRPKSETAGFISRIDREYLETLVMIGCGEEASELVRRAYDARRPEIENRRWFTPSTQPLTDLDIDYLEALIIVGDRRRAISALHQIIEQYELKVRGELIRAEEAPSAIDREYIRVMDSIENRDRKNDSPQGRPGFLSSLADILKSIGPT